MHVSFGIEKGVTSNPSYSPVSASVLLDALSLRINVAPAFIGKFANDKSS